GRRRLIGNPRERRPYRFWGQAGASGRLFRNEAGDPRISVPHAIAVWSGLPHISPCRKCLLAESARLLATSSQRLETARSEPFCRSDTAAPRECSRNKRRCAPIRQTMERHRLWRPGSRGGRILRARDPTLLRFPCPPQHLPVLTRRQHSARILKPSRFASNERLPSDIPLRGPSAQF